MYLFINEVNSLQIEYKQPKPQTTKIKFVLL